MKKKIKDTYTNIVLKYSYALINIFSSFYLINLYLNNFDIKIYGSWIIIIGIISWFNIIDPGNSNLIIQKISSNKLNNQHNREVAILNSFVISSIILILGVSCSKILIDQYFDNTIDNEELILIFRISIVSLSLMVISFSFLSILEGSFKNLIGGIILNTYIILKVILIIYLVNKGFGIKSIAISDLIASFCCLISAVITYFFVQKKINFFKISSFYYFSYTKLLLINFSSKLAKVISKNIDIILIGKLISIEFTTIYYLLTILPKYTEGLIGLLFSALRALIGSINKKYNKKKLKNIYKVSELNIVWIMGIYVCLLLNFNEFFVNIWTHQNINDQNNISFYITLIVAIKIISNFNQTIVYNFGKIKESNFIDLLYIIILIPTLYISLAFINLKTFFLFFIFIECIFHFYRFRRIIHKYLLLDNFNYIYKDLLIILFFNIIIYFSYLIFNISIKSWIELIFLITITIVVYFVILFLLSSNFRKQLYLIKNIQINK